MKLDMWRFAENTQEFSLFLPQLFFYFYFIQVQGKTCADFESRWGMVSKLGTRFV
jgi:hypothetical protein